jgi:hypothetical protein
MWSHDREGMPVQELKTRIRELIADTVRLDEELDRLRGFEVERALGAPSRPEQIAAIERVAGFGLPVDYRAFLELHNGWRGFSGENDLLSAEQMTSGAMRDSILETKELQRENSDPAAGGFVINASVSGTDIAYIDPSTITAQGSAEVVRWDPRMREYKRAPSFIAYLEDHVASLERRIAKERAKLR